MDDRQLIADLLSALEYHTEQTRPIEFSKVAIQAAREYLQKPAQQQETVAWLVYENWRKHSLFFTKEGAEYFKNASQRNDDLSGNLARWKTEPLYTSPPEQQEPVAWPAGLIERIKAAEQRIQDGHAPRRIPADPTDVDLVLAEVRCLLEGKQPPFWIQSQSQTKGEDA